MSSALPASRLYECTVYYQGQPWILDGQPVQREIVATTAGKARYSYWLDVHESWDEIKLMDIRVRSLSSRDAHWRLSPGWEQRMDFANAIIKVVAAHGRHFLSENSDRQAPVADPFIAHFRMDSRGELWFVDRYSRKPVLVRLDKWRGFTDGGTLRDYVKRLAEHIETGSPLELRRIAVYNYWGYGGDAVVVNEKLAELLEVNA